MRNPIPFLLVVLVLGFAGNTVANEGWDGLIDDGRISDYVLSDAPTEAQPDFPLDGAIIVGDTAGANIWTKLIFIPGPTAVSHVGYFNEDYSKVESRDPAAYLGPPPYATTPGWEYALFAGNPAVPPADYTLVRGTRYYWTVDANDALNNTFAGDIWSFAIQGYKAFSPSPPNEAVFISVTPFLSWLPGFIVEDHDIYMGTSWEDVNNARYNPITPPSEFVFTRSDPNYQCSGLATDTKLYWRVDQVNGRMPPPIGGGTYYIGDIWEFTTAPPGLGTINYELWENISGSLDALLTDPCYPGYPTSSGQLNAFDTEPVLPHIDYYGGQIEGLLYPPITGDYTFWIATDEDGELWLSTDEKPCSAELIAYIPADSYANPYEWEKYSSQTSGPISLDSTRKYYIMARWKEELGDDHCMVAWQGPSMAEKEVIHGGNLEPFKHLLAWAPVPRDGANVGEEEVAISLNWLPGDGVVSHDVYFGTDQAAVTDANQSSPEFQINLLLGIDSYMVTDLVPFTTYYWRIDEVNESNVSKGCIWSFITDVDCNGNLISDSNDIADGTSLDCNGNGIPDECDIADGTSLDCNGNGIPDECDIALGTSLDCNGNGIPDECDIALGTSLDCNGNGIPDECDIADGTSQDINGNGVPDECDPDCNGNGVPDDVDIRTGTSLDCNGNGIPDECDIATGTSQDINGNGVPDECDPDCNGNGVPDDVDIATGTSLDCNGNGIPDECDIALGTSLDCNGNGIPDECDIAIGTSQDINGNGVPDECDPDCNGNGVPDDVDIATGTSLDINGNGVPDECDSSLLAWYKFDEGTGTTAFDSSGNENHGVITGATWVVGQLGGALNFDGDYVDCGNPPVLNFGTGDWSLCAWIKNTMTGTGEDNKGSIIANGGDSSGGHRYSLIVSEQEEGKVTLTIDDNGADSIGSSYGKKQARGYITKVNDGIWHHVLGMREGDTIKVYIDGNLEGTTGLPFSYDLSGTVQHNVLLGAITDNGDGSIYKYYEGLIDDVQIYSQALTVEEIQDVMFGIDKASNPNPANGAVHYATSTVLSWTPGVGAVSHNVYFGTDQAAVTNANESSPEFQANLPLGTESYTVTDLVPFSTYYWRIDEVNGSKGSIWFFRNGIDCNGNGVPDDVDIATGTSQDINGNGIPDECDPDCNGNGVPDDVDITTGTSLDCNGNGIPDECDIATGTSQDINGNGVPDECDPDCNANGIPDDVDITTGTSLDCNGNGIPDECDIALGTSLDCNGNGIPDECDIALGTSLDCNGNGIPDECDIALGTSLDCNGNGIPDECDIADGTSQDINRNGVPDECEPDCNGNGIPDSYDISQGTSSDINSDGIPDECQFDIMIVPVAVLDNPSQTGEVRTELPESITEIPQQGSTYYLEIWASDIGDTNTGLTGVYVDIPFCAEVSATDIQHGGIFTTFTSGTPQPSGVDEFGGSALPSGGGIEPEWVRVGWIEMTVNVDASSCTMSLLPSSSGVAAFGRGTISWEDIHLGSLSLLRDCNGNSIPDADDIILGTSLDCNGNGVPDECDIASGTSLDCNGNGIPDECDITSGTSIDGNGDGIPDECQIDVQIVPVAIGIEPNSTSEVRTALPESLSAVARGTRYYIEVWASDSGAVNSGLTDVYVDLSFCGQTSAMAVEHGTIFTTSASGTIQPSGVDEFGGSALPSGGGIEPNWIRVGWIEMIADLEASNCTITLLPSSTGVAALGRGSIHWALIELGTVDLEITPPPRSYDLQVDGFINVGDLSFFGISWLENVPPGENAHDFDCDCFVGVGDLSWFATGWLKNTNDPTILYPPCPGGGSCGAEASMSSMIIRELTSVSSTVTVNSGPTDVVFELAVLDAQSVSDTTTVVPTSIDTISNGQTYYLEVWASDHGYINTGFTSAYVDLSFPDDAASVVNISHSGIFTAFTSGSVISGKIDELGGSVLPGGVGIEPEWVRVAIVEMHADAAPRFVVFTLSPSSTGVGAYGRGSIDFKDISLPSVTIGLPADLNDNGRVDFFDFAIFGNQWRGTPGDPSADIAPEGGDGKIDSFDLAMFVEYWLEEITP
jgi:hypothetical protein